MLRRGMEMTIKDIIEKLEEELENAKRMEGK